MNRKKSMPTNWINIHAIIQNNEKGIPKINGSTLLPTLYIGNINKVKINILNKKK